MEIHVKLMPIVYVQNEIRTKGDGFMLQSNKVGEFITLTRDSDDATHSKKISLPPASDVSHTFQNPPVAVSPRIVTATIPPTMSKN